MLISFQSNLDLDCEYFYEILFGCLYRHKVVLSLFLVGYYVDGELNGQAEEFGKSLFHIEGFCP